MYILNYYIKIKISIIPYSLLPVTYLGESREGGEPLVVNFGEHYDIVRHLGHLGDKKN